MAWFLCVHVYIYANSLIFVLLCFNFMFIIFQSKLGIKYQLPSTQSSPFVHKNIAEAEKNVFDTIFRILAFNIKLLNLCSIPNLACNLHSLDEKQLHPEQTSLCCFSHLWLLPVIKTVSYRCWATSIQKPTLNPIIPLKTKKPLDKCKCQYEEDYIGGEGWKCMPRL